MRTLDLARHLTASLRAHPDEWVFNAYDAEHRSGVRVWLAHGYAGLHIREKACMSKIGDITFWSVFFGKLIPWRRALGRQFFAEQRRRLEFESQGERIVARISSKAMEAGR